MDNLVSVIVPVYNTREYLAKCIKSIQNQTHQELEIIIVDNGSTDGSSELCTQLQSGDKRIIVIHKEHGGVVSARRRGLEEAKGEYSLLVDSDDWIEPEMIESLYKITVMYQADVVTSGMYKDYDDTSVTRVDGIEEGIYDEDNKEDLYRNLIFMEGSEQDGILVAVWNKLIRTVLMRELHEKLSDEVTAGEDAAIVYAYCMRAKKIIVTHNVFYHHVVRSNSATVSVHPYFLRGTNELYLYLKNEIANNAYMEILLPQLEKYLVVILFRGINSYLGLSHTVTIPQYDFAKNIIEQDARVVLYGAGEVGQSYYKQIRADKLYRLVGWVDKNFSDYRERGMGVLPIEKLEEMEYDYIILALKYQDRAEQIKDNLMEQFKIPADKFVWLKPIGIMEKYQVTDKED